MTAPFVYDKAKYHYEGKFPRGLATTQAFVHTGLFLGWLIDRGLTSDEFLAESSAAVARFKAREITGPQIYAEWDGCLLSSMLSDEGNAFAAAYFDFDRGQYLNDYEELFLGGLPSLYHVSDTWENYERLKARIDERYTTWRAKTQRGPGANRWKFWKR